MKIERIMNSNDPRCKAIWDIYETSFPADERRDLDKEIEFLDEGKFELYSLSEISTPVGFMTIWRFDDFSFLEHFAIREDLRGNGLGTNAMKHLQKMISGFIVFEVERPSASTDAQRRVNFYERVGFELNRHDYIQPAYSQTKKPVPMFIMSHPKQLLEQEFVNIRDVVHRNVYGLKQPITELS